MARRTVFQVDLDWYSDILAAIVAGSASSGVQGVVADGAAAGTTKPVIVGGVDGSSNAQSWLFDTSGRGVVVGAAADGAAAAGNPVLIAGMDGSNNAQSILTDTGGRFIVNAAGGATPSDTATNAEFQGPTSATGTSMRGFGSAIQVWDGSTNWKRALTATGASNTTASGLLGVGSMAFDGTNYQRLTTVSVGSIFPLHVIPTNAAGQIWVMGSGAGDGTSGAQIPSSTLWLYNESNWDRRRSNTQVTALASAARTAQTDSADITNYNAVGIMLFVDVTTGAATPGVTPTIQVKDSISGNYKTIWTAAAAITSTAANQYVYFLHPGHATGGAATEAVQMCIPRTFRVRMTVADADSLTYSVSVALIY